MATCSIDKCKAAIVAALEREVGPLVRNWNRIQREHERRTYVFFESRDVVCICGGIGSDAARRAAEGIIALYHPQTIYSVGFAGALDSTLHVGQILTPATIVDARDGSRIQIQEAQLAQGSGALLTFPHIASASQKSKLGEAYGAQAVDMEAAAVAAAAAKHGIAFAAIKAISDESGFEIPGMERFIDHNGRFRTIAFVLHAAMRPWLWARIVQLAHNSRSAANALAKQLCSVLSAQQQTSTSAASGRRA
jgi:adenosylhomocysteine nucleosidase